MKRDLHKTALWKRDEWPDCGRRVRHAGVLGVPDGRGDNPRGLRRGHGPLQRDTCGTPANGDTLDAG